MENWDFDSIDGLYSKSNTAKKTRSNFSSKTIFPKITAGTDYLADGMIKGHDYTRNHSLEMSNQNLNISNAALYKNVTPIPSSKVGNKNRQNYDSSKNIMEGNAVSQIHVNNEKLVNCIGSLRDFLLVACVMILWIGASVVVSLPLVFAPSSIKTYLQTPYVTLWIAVLSHAMIYKKMFSKTHKYLEFLTANNFILFSILWLVESCMLSGTLWILNYYELMEGPQYFVLVTIPCSLIFLVHFSGFYILYKWFTDLRILMTWKHRAMAMFGMQTLIFQLTVALYLGFLFVTLNEIDSFLGIMVCVLYPFLIGAVKIVEKKLTASFDVGEIYEFTALSLAAMPYRFIFLDVDRLLIAFWIIFIKFSYKIYVNFIIYTPLFKELVKRWKGKNNIVTVKKEIKVKVASNVPNCSNKHDNSPAMNNTQHTKSEEKVVDEIEKQTITQSQKFFFQQFLDSWDILAALVIVLTLRNLEDNLISNLGETYYYLFILESWIEFSFEAAFTLTLPFIIAKWSVLKDFSPIKHTKEVFRDNIVYFSISALLIFPLFIYIINK